MSACGNGTGESVDARGLATMSSGVSPTHYISPSGRACSHMPDNRPSHPHTRRWSGLRRSALATTLVGTSVLVGSGLFVPTAAAAAALCASPPLTGTTTATGVINTYYPGQTAIVAGTASTTATVGTSRGSATPIAVGDLVLVIQMQGVQIDSTNTNTYGGGVSSATASGYLTNASFIAGQYEYATVTSVAGSVVGVSGAGANGGLVNGYADAAETATQGRQRYQIVRVPQYSSASLSAATPPAAVAWDGSSGGIVVLDVASDLNLNGATIDVTGQGFRAGLQRSRSGTTGLVNTDYRTATAKTANGQKGEGIAGTTKWTTGAADGVGDGYPNGDFARGAPGNAGGGGTDGDPTSNGENSGGGGGGNGGAGGVGGNTWSSNLARGGYGGVVVPGTASRVFMGGGGGAGSDNNAVLSSTGGPGGGIVLVRAGSLSGTGTINADGSPGNISGQDGSGGGGAGGSIVVLTSLTGAASGISGLTVRARGGAGGNETHADQHGPGGGGGGGRVITSAATSSTTVTGGVSGIHVATSSAYGATAGAAGASSATAVMTDPAGTNTGSQCIDVSVTKNVGSSPVIPGQTVTYTVVATNNGPYPRTGTAPVVVTDTLPAVLTSATWTCTASAGSSCTASGSGSLSTTANLEVGDSATYVITATLASTFTGTLSNTATVAGPGTIPELTAANNTATAATLAEPRVNLGVTKTDGVATAVPGTNVTYTIVASNAGPSTATAAPITDALPSGATSGTWTCAAGGGGTCGAASGTLPMSTTATLSPAGSVTYTVIVAVSSTATGSLANTVNIAAPAGVVETNSANNSATDTDSLTPTADLSISKTDGLTTINAGTALTYTIVASNAGPSAITGATVTDTMPATLSGVTWTCTASVGSSCPASGSGSISASINVLAAGSVTFTVSATVVSTATGTLSNTASVALPGGSTDPTPGNNSATDTTTINRRADVSVTKTDGSATAVPGSTVTYTIVASNAGPSAALATTVTDTLPATLSGATWTCTASAGSTCPASGSGNISTTVDLLPGGTATFTLTATVASTATGTLANTATVAVAAGITDPTAANNTATDTDTLVPTADLSITKTDGSAGEVPGTPVTYTIVASSAGPSSVTAATVTDTLPATITGATWTCAASAGSSCPASGSGNISASVNLAPGGTATFTLTGTISASATGTVANTATIAAPASVTDPTPANNTATDTDTLTPTGDLSITKTDGVASTIPGQGLTYTIVAANAGPSVITGATVADTFPAAFTGVTWTCAASAGSSCPASGSGNINASVNLLVSGTATFTVSGSVSAAATGSLVNTATIAAPVGSGDTNGANNTATDTDSLTPSADLSITKTDGSATEVPGTPVTYTVVVSNAGPSAAPASNVTDPFPASLTGATWTCTTTGGAVCPVSGSGNINASVDLPVGATATFTVSATVAAGATGSLTNTATASVGAGVTDPASGNNTATDTDTLNPTADLVITKTDGATTAVPGASVTYTIIASNAGPSTITGATVADTMPASLSGVTWTCTASAGSSCPASGSGSISALVTLLPSGTATFTVTGTISSSATGSLSNTATIALPGGSTDPTPGNNSATDSDTLNPTADLSITKTDGSLTEVPGTSVTYTVVASNAGPSAVSAATVTDTMPVSLSGVTWTCAGAAGGTCPASGSGSISASVNLPVGASVTFTISATVVASATGTLVNTATIAAPGGVTDPTPGNNSATDSDTLNPTADLSITKTDGSLTEVPGTSVTYTVVASNAGPSAVSAATVTDTMPASLSGVTWTCVPAGGGSCAAGSGSGNIATTVDLPVGATATFTISATVVATATGTLVNTATVAVPAGVTDPTPANNSATDTDTLNPTADLSITKTDGIASVVPGQNTTYTVVVGNAGPSTAVNAPVTDALPAGATSGSWTCAASAGATCGAASGAMPISSTATLASGATVTYTVVVAVASTATGSLTNTATVSAPAGVTDPSSANNSASDIDTLTPTADVSITKTDGLTTVVPGTIVTYTVVASNPGPSTVTGATVADTIPASLIGATWTCSASAGSTCPVSGSGNMSAAVTLAPGGTATFTITATVIASATGTISNTATITLPGTVTDPTPANNTATDLTTVTPQTDLTITKTDGTASAVPGQSTTYTVVVGNTGPSSVVGASVTDSVPAGLTSMTWTCAGTGGGICPAAGSGSISSSVDLPVGASVTFTITAVVGAGATGTLTNSATVSAPLGVTDTNAANNTATDVDSLTPRADLAVTKTDGVASVIPGQSTTYTVTVANNGPSNAPATSVTDAVPSGESFTSWTCTPSAGAGCTAASGSGAINTTVTLPVGTTATFTIVAAIGPAATGTVANTATATPSAGIVDPTPANNSATDTDALTPTADLSITKTNLVASVVPGTAVSYTITATNAGPSAVTGAAVADTLPASLTSATWTCAATGGGSCTASGSGSIIDTVNLPVGATVTYTVTGTAAAAATGTITNTASVTAPPGVTDPVPGNNTATDSDPLTPQVDLSITKTDGRAVANPLDTLTYTIAVRNAGPSAVADAVVTDTVPASLTGVTWTCADGLGGHCDNAGPVLGSINTTVDLGVNGGVMLTVTGTIAGPTVGSVVNTANVSTPAGVSETNSADNSATDSTAVTTTAALSITKTDGQTTDVAGTSSTYTITVVNSGPSSVVDAAVTDVLPAAFTNASWTCVASGAGNCDNAGPTSGDINTTVDLPSGGSATFTVTGTIAAAFTGVLSNTATVTAPPGTIDDPADNTSTDTTTIVAQANLVVTKSDGTSTATPGSNTVYIVTVLNAGPSTVTGATIADPLPAGATAMNWTCTSSAGSSCTASGSGGLGDTVTLLPGGQLTYLVTVNISAAAAGTLSNTVTATVPATVTETSPLDNTATDVDTLVATTDLAITKTDNATTAVPGTGITYTIVATNNGPSDALGATVTDSVPAGLSGVTWTCIGACAPSGTGAINEVVSLPVGASVTFTVSATIATSATGTLTNTAIVTPAAGATDPNPANNSASDTDTLLPQADLSITKTDGAAVEVPGTPVTYTIVVANSGPSDVVGASVVDAFAANLSNATWSCVAVGGSCPAAGVGNINTTLNLIAGGTATFTVTANVAASATGSVSNTATVTAPPAATDPNPGNNSATDVDALAPEVDLSVTKTDNDLSAQPGDAVTYLIVVTNAGPSAVVAAPFTDVAPASLVGVSWTCAASAGSSCAASGSGNAINTSVSLLPSGSATFTVNATVAGSASGVIANTASIDAPLGVTETAPADNTATDTTSVTPTADLLVTKTDGLTSIAAGEVDTYTIVVTNAGPSTIAGASVTDVVPASIVGATWTCAASAGSTCGSASGSGNINQLVTLLTGGTATLTVTGTLAASTAAGTLTNTVNVAMPVGSIDPTPANNQATDNTAIVRHADIEVQKTDGASSATPGQTVQYTVVVTNHGPSNVAGVNVTDSLPAVLTGATWTCTTTAGSVCSPSGSGSINTLVDLLSGGTATFTIDATVAASALGVLANTATASVPPGVIDPVPGNNSATDTDTLNPVADLAITKTDFSPTATPGAPVTYTVVVSNAGPSAVVGATVADALPASMSAVSWTCSISGSGSCPASGTGNVNVPVSLTVGATATFTITGTLLASTTANLVNTASVIPPAGVTDPTPGNNSATDVDTLARIADLAITKTDFASSATPGTTVSYQIIATNGGPSDIVGATVADIPPAELSGVTWLCAATGGASCATSSGVTAINELVDIPVGGSVTFTLTATLSASATSPVANTATITPPVGATDPNPANDSATDTDTPVRVADLSLTKSVDLPTALPGDVVHYTVVVGNAGPSDINDAPVSDIIPAGLTAVSWTCAPSAGGNCDQVGPVSGNIAATVDLVVGGSVTFTVTVTVAPSATGTIVNTAAVAAPAGSSDPDPSNNTASASTTINPKADLSITKTDGNVTDIAGTSIQYSIVITNNGPSTIANAPVGDVIPAPLSGVSWACAASPSSTCDNPTGTGNISATIDLVAGGTATFIVDATIDPAFAGVLSNTATVTMPGVGVDPTPGNNTATDTTTVFAQADLSITKTDGTLTATPGGTTVYTVTVGNAGPSTVIGAAVTDALPAGASAMSWTCAASAGSSCAASGSGALVDSVTLLPGDTATYQVTVAISSAATGTLVNTGTVVAPVGVTDPAPANDTATDLDTLTPRADLSVTKTDGVATAVPGTPVSYTIVATNAGPSDAVGATASDNVPASLVGATWTCIGSNGGTCTASGAGSVADTVNLPVGATVTYSITATLGAAATGTLVNTASISSPSGSTDPDLSNNTATDTDTLTPRADLFVTKTDGQPNVVPGTPVTYTVVAGNAGPSAVAGATVTDLLPAALLGATWTCTATGGSCPASGTGNIAASIDLAVGGTATFTIDATVSPVASSTLANTVTIAAPSGVTDPVAGNNTATDTDTLNPEADLSITKTDGRVSAHPGDAITYTIVVANAGPSAVIGAPVVDTLPAGLGAASWTCTPSVGASCAPSGSGNINTTVGLAVGATATFTITTSVTATTGVVVNSARIDAPAGVSDQNPADNVATDTTSITPTADLSITKTDGLTNVAAGEVVTYTVVATNAGPSPIIAANVTDSLPGVLVAASWTCSATVGSTCANPTGLGSINELVDLAAGGQVTFSITATVNASAAVGLLSNTATITMPVGSVDPTPPNNAATDTTAINRRADLSISKNDFTGNAVAGGSTTYTVVVANSGPSNAFGASVADAIPTGATTMSWTCSATAGASCAPSGSGAIGTVVNLAAGSSMTFTVVVGLDPAASGVLNNTATVVPPAGVTDPNPADNSASDVDAIVGVADLTITKTDGSPTATPGTTTTYTVVVTNNGPSNVISASVADVAPAGVTFTSWTCAASAGAGCASPSGSGNIATTVDLAIGASATYTINASIGAAVAAPVANTATITAPGGVTDPNLADNTATDTDTMAPIANLSITKSDGSATVTPGGSVVYTVVATNAGPSNVIGAAVTDLVPPAVVGATWTCAGNGGGTCGISSGTAPLNQLVNLPVGGSVTLTITGAVDPALSANLTNTATIAAPVGVTDPDLSNNTATDVDTPTPVADLGVTKTDGLASALPGDVVTYTVAISNSGPSNVVGATVADAVPGALTGVTWTCAAVNGSCPASGSGSLNQPINVAVGGTVTFSVTGTVVGSATGSIVNTATVTAPAGTNDPNPGNNSATDVTSVNPKADLSITKTDGNLTDVAGTTVTYTIAVTNAGPSRVTGAPVADVLPAQLSGETWACVATAGSTCGALGGAGNISTDVDLLSGGVATFTVTATIAASFTGTLSNTATVAMPAPGVDPTPANNTATDTTAIVAVADLSVTKTDGSATEVPGTAVSYTIVVTNAGPSNVVGASVADGMPSTLSNVSWSCAAAGSATCSPSGTGDIADVVSVPAGGSVTYTVTGLVAADATGTLVNTASATVPGGVTDPDLSNNSATDVDTLSPSADLSVTKTDGVVSEEPGTPVSYTIVVSNAGPSNVVGAAVVDVMPASILGATWTCSAAGGTCAASGSGNINTSVDLAVGGAATFTVNGTVSTSATGSITNSVSVTVPVGVTDPNPANNAATDVDALVPTADLSVTKTDGVASEVPGTPITYSVVVSNAGPSDIVGATVTDLFPASLTGGSWACAAVDGTCAASGSGSINTTVALAVGGTATFTVSGTVSSAATGSITNSASITPPPGAVDPNPANNSAADTDALDPVADLAITKTDNDTNARPGDSITYQIVASNAGPSAIVGAVVTDTMPAGITGVTWTCAPASGGSCPAAGSGDLNESVDLAVGSSVTFTVTATVSATAGTLSNTAQIDVPPGAVDPNTLNNAATDTTQIDPVGDLSITKTDGQISAVPGAPTVYTIAVTNSGPSAAAGVAVTDTMPATLLGVTWTCTATPGSACTNPSGAGDISELVDVAAGGTVTFVVSATIAAGATGVLTNTASLVPPAGFTDSNLADNSATDSTNLAPAVDLSVTKSDAQVVVVPGTPTSYTIIVSNNGPSVSTGANVLDSLPAALLGATWTCNAAPGSACGAASGSGSINQIVNVGVGSSITYIVSATVSPSAVGLLANMVTVTPAAGITDTNPANNSAIDVDSLTPQANLSIVKTDGAASAVPGTPITYSVIVSNAGPSAVSGAAVTDVLPAALNAASWTCTASAGGSCGVASGTGDIVTTVDLQAGATATYTLSAVVDAAATGNLTNTATVAAPVGVVDPTVSDNASTDTDTLTLAVDLAITKTDGVTSVVPGTSTTYTITVTNSGPSSAVGAQITDLLPAEITAATWGCVAAGGATCGTPGGSGDVTVLATVPVGGSLTITVAASLDPAATGFVVNTATVVAPSGVVDTNPANGAATDSDALTSVADLSITKTDGLASALPGDPVTYTVVVTNNGPSAVVGAPVTDLMPAGLTGVTWACGASPGSSCVPGGAGNIATTVDLAVGGTATFTIDATIASNQLGVVTNTATVDAPAGVTDPNSANNVAVDATIVNGLGDVSIVKTDGVATIVAGTSTTYTIVVTNPGPSQIDGIQVTDALPATLLGATWTCTPTGGAACGAATGSGSINQLIDMPAATTVTFTVTATVSSSAGGLLSNTANVALPIGVVDSDPANNTSTDLTTITQVADLSVTKTDHVASLTPGTPVSYDIVATNSGPSAVVGATLTDLIPGSITGATWTCTPSAGAACAAAGGSGNVSLGVDLAVGANVAVRVTGTVSPGATGTLVNSAVIAPPVTVTDPTAGNNTATDADTLTPVADIAVTKSNGVVSQSPGATSSYIIAVTNAGPSAAPGVVIDDPLPVGVTTVSWTCSASAASSCASASGTGAINTTVALAVGGTVTFTVSLQAGPSAGSLTNTVTATVPPGISDPNPANNVASDTDTLVFTADIAVTKTASAATVPAGQSFGYTVMVANRGPDPATGVSVLDTMPAGLTNASWTCSATPGSSCPASGTGDIATTVDLLAGGSATFAIIATVTNAAPNTVVNTATAAVGAGTVDPNPANNTASATIAVDFTTSLTLTKTASVATALPGDTFTYDIVVGNGGPAALNGVAISDPVPSGLIPLTWTCVGSAGGVCTSASGTGSPVLGADLPVGSHVTVTLVVQIAPGASGPILNIVTATAGTVSQPVTAQASANVEVSPVVPPATGLSITKSTASLTYSAVDGVVTYTLVATNTGTVTLTGVTITDANATLANCAPVTLTPGQTITCTATHLVTQADLDRGTLTNTASVSGLPPTGPAVSANSAAVVTPAMPHSSLEVTKSSPSTSFSKVGDQIAYTITATNTGNVTLTSVSISDPNGVLGVCVPTNLAPGQSLSCTATHTVTAADVATKVIVNQAAATASPVTDFEVVCPLLSANGLQCPATALVSAESNTVVLNRAANLPTTGSVVVSKLVAGGELFGLGGLLLLVGRRRKPRRRR